MAPKQALRLQNGGNGNVKLCNYNSKAQVALTMDQLRAAQHITAPILPLLKRLGMDGANVQLDVDMMPTLEVMTTTGWQPIGQVQVGFQPRPVDQLVMDEFSVRLQGGEHRKFSTFNNTAVVRVGQDMLRGKERVEPQLVDFLAYLGNPLQAGAVMPVIEVVRSGQWVDLNDAPRRHDEDSNLQKWFAWNSRLQPVAVSFNAPTYNAVVSFISKMELWVRQQGFWCTTPADWQASTLRLTNSKVTYSEAVEMKQQGGGLPWLAWRDWLTPSPTFAPSLQWQDLPAHFSLWDWLEHGALLECHAGILQIALQPYHVYEYLVSWYKALARGDKKAATFFKVNFKRQLRFMAQAWATEQHVVFAKEIYRMPELKFAAASSMFVAALIGFTQDSHLTHSGEGTLTHALNLPREGLGPRLNEATLSGDMQCYVRPVLGAKRTTGLLGRRVFGKDEQGDEHVHCASMGLPLLRTGPAVCPAGVRSVGLANVNRLGRRPGSQIAAFALQPGLLRQPLDDVNIKVQRGLNVIADELRLPLLSSTEMPPSATVKLWLATDAASVPGNLDARIEAAML